MARVTAVIAKVRELLQKNPIARYGLMLLVVVVAAYLVAGRLFGGRGAPPAATRLPAPPPSAVPGQLPPPPLPGQVPGVPGGVLAVTGIVGDGKSVAVIVIGGRTEIIAPGDQIGDLRVLRIDATRRTVTFLQAGKRFDVAMGGD